MFINLAVGAAAVAMAVHVLGAWSGVYGGVAWYLWMIYGVLLIAGAVGLSTAVAVDARRPDRLRPMFWYMAMAANIYAVAAFAEMMLGNANGFIGVAYLVCNALMFVGTYRYMVTIGVCHVSSLVAVIAAVVAVAWTVVGDVFVDPYDAAFTTAYLSTGMTCLAAVVQAMLGGYVSVGRRTTLIMLGFIVGFMGVNLSMIAEAGLGDGAMFDLAMTVANGGVFVPFAVAAWLPPPHVHVVPMATRRIAYLRAAPAAAVTIGAAILLIVTGNLTGFTVTALVVATVAAAWRWYLAMVDAGDIRDVLIPTGESGDKDDLTDD